MQRSQLPHIPATTARAAATTAMPVSCNYSLQLWSWVNPPSGNTVKTLSQQWLKKLGTCIGFRFPSVLWRIVPKDKTRGAKETQRSKHGRTDELWPVQQWCRTYRKTQSVPPQSFRLPSASASAVIFQHTPPHTHTQEDTALYGRKLFFADINPGLSCAAPCGILCHVYPDNHSSPLQGFSSSRASNMKSRLREGKRDQVKRHPKGTPQKTDTSRYRRNLKRAVLCCGPHPHLRTRVWPLAVVLGESHVEKGEIRLDRGGVSLGVSSKRCPVVFDLVNEI